MVNYHDRVTVYRYEISRDRLGSMKRERLATIVPCRSGRVSLDEQLGIFGSYQQQAVKLHLQGVHENIEEVLYSGAIRQVRSVRYGKHSTVIVL